MSLGMTAATTHRDRLLSALALADIAAQKLSNGTMAMTSALSRGLTPDEGKTRDVETAMADLLDAMATIRELEKADG